MRFGDKEKGAEKAERDNPYAADVAMTAPQSHVGQEGNPQAEHHHQLALHHGEAARHHEAAALHHKAIATHHDGTAPLGSNVLVEHQGAASDHAMAALEHSRRTSATDTTGRPEARTAPTSDIGNSGHTVGIHDVASARMQRGSGRY